MVPIVERTPPLVDPLTPMRNQTVVPSRKGGCRGEMKLYQVIQDITAADFIDISLVAALVYGLLLALRRSHATFILVGMLSLGVFYVLSLTLGLRLTTYVFQTFFTVLLVAMIVIFQEEIRSFFERVAVWVFHRDNRKKQVAILSPTTEVLVASVSDFARKKIGALLVLQGKDQLPRHLKGGVLLDGVVSEPMLGSIFDPNSPGHDGALVLAGNRAVQFACHLPLSADMMQLAKRGTRHAAALGLAERTDALCIVVSEERGTVSVARHGKLTQLDDPQMLRQAIEDFQRELHPPRSNGSFLSRILRQNLHLKAAAILLSLVLWFFFVYESVIEYRSFVVPVEHTGLPTGYKVASIEPSNVRVVVSGPRRAFYLISSNDFRIVVKLHEAVPGDQEITLASSDLTLPDNVMFGNIIPRPLNVTIVSYNGRRP